MTGSRAKYITLIEIDDGIVYKTGSHVRYVGNQKLMVAPVLEDDLGPSYDSMGLWYGTNEYKNWVYEEAKKWADELDTQIIIDSENTPNGCRPIPFN